MRVVYETDTLGTYLPDAFGIPLSELRADCRDHLTSLVQRRHLWIDIEALIDSADTLSVLTGSVESLIHQALSYTIPESLCGYHGVQQAWRQKTWTILAGESTKKEACLKSTRNIACWRLDKNWFLIRFLLLTRLIRAKGLEGKFEPLELNLEHLYMGPNMYRVQGSHSTGAIGIQWIIWNELYHLTRQMAEVLRKSMNSWETNDFR